MILQSPDSYPQRARAALGRARLVHWDAPPLRERLQGLLARLSAPLGVAVEGGTDAQRAALASELERAGGASVRVVEIGADAVATILPASGRVVPGRPPAACLGIVGADEDAEAAGRRWAGVVRTVVPLDLDRPVVVGEEGTPGRAADGPPPARAEQAVPRRAALPDVPTDLAADPSGPSASRLTEPAEQDPPSAALVAALADLTADADPLRASGVLAELRELLLAHPRRGGDEVLAEVESIELSSPEPRELAARVALGSGAASGLSAADHTSAREILDAARALAGAGLRLQPARTDAAEAGLGRWRALASDPTLPRLTREVAETVGRACERLLASTR